MSKASKKEIFFNRAEVEEAEHIICNNCFEQVVFLLKDKDHEFSVGLSTIVECLAFAIKNGDLPKLPSSWLNLVDSLYRSVYSFDENLCYYDYKIDADVELDDEYLQKEENNKSDNNIRYFKTEQKKDAERFEINLKKFEKKTQRKWPFVQENEDGGLSEYAICPSCLNPIQIIGIMHNTKLMPHGIHTKRNVKGLAKWNEENYKRCPYQDEP